MHISDCTKFPSIFYQTAVAYSYFLSYEATLGFIFSRARKNVFQNILKRTSHISGLKLDSTTSIQTMSASKDASMILPFFLCCILLSYCESQNACLFNSDLHVCDVEISEKPIADITSVHRTGETLETCLNALEDFYWDVAVFCSDLNFCGLGIDLFIDYRSYWDREKFSPAQTTCLLITDTKHGSCETLEKNLLRAGLFSSKSLHATNYF